MFRQVARTVKIVGNVLFWSLLAVLVLGSLAVRYDMARVHVMRTGSMAPDYDTGSMVVLTKMPRDEVRVGDVIAFVPPNRDAEDRYVHRIESLDRLPDSTLVLVTKGDANPGVDDFAPFRVSAPEVWAARFSAPNVGTWAATAGKPEVRNVLMGVGAAALIVPLLWFIWSPKNKKPDENEDENEPATVDTESDTVAPTDTEPDTEAATGPETDVKAATDTEAPTGPETATGDPTGTAAATVAPTGTEAATVTPTEASTATETPTEPASGIKAATVAQEAADVDTESAP